MKKFKTLIIANVIVLIFNLIYPSIYVLANEIETNVSKKNETNLEYNEEEKIANNVNNIDNEINNQNVNNNSIMENKTNEINENTSNNVVTDNQIIEENKTNSNNSIYQNITEPENNTDKDVIKDDLESTKIGKINIDSPTNNTEYRLQDTKYITLIGWALSNDENVKVKLYINGSYLADIERTIERVDVINANPGYNSNTNKVGFSYEIDVNDFTENICEIKLDLISESGEILDSSTKIINILNQDYTGEINIESPQNNSTYKLPDTEKITLTGWGISNDENAKVKLYVNDSYWTDIERTIVRNDVISAKPEYNSSTNKVGFSHVVDISAFPEGVQKIRVDIVSRFGEILETSTVNIKITHNEYKGTLWIDAPQNNSTYKLPDTEKVTLTGWGISNDENAKVKLYVNDSYWTDIERTIVRNDVISAKPEYNSSTNKVGFSHVVDISAFPEGVQKIRVDIVSRFGEILETSTVNIKITHNEYKGTLWIDAPQNNSTYKLPDTEKVTLTGWGISNDENAKVKLYVNDSYWTDIERTIVRNDVISAKPEYNSSTNKVGFSTSIDISQFPDGQQEIRVDIVSRFGKVISSYNRNIKIDTPSYPGIMNIEEPIRNKIYSTGTLTVRGWALSEDKNDSIKIYLDGKSIGVATRTERNDVFNIYNNNEYGGIETTPLPGFVLSINTESLTQGMHTIRVVNISGYRKEIQSMEVTFRISNTIKAGIDVSQYQGNIDWNSVKNSGVNFAILRIGYYLESQGRAVIDPYFEQNYNACKSLGIAVGGYFYSYAFNSAEASREAQACLSAISGKSFEMPIFLDVEDNILKNAVADGRTNKNELTNASITFCDIMNSSGYRGGVYASKNFFIDYLNVSVLERYDIWLAHYTEATDYTGKFDIWQYTSSGSIPGINGNVDLDWCFTRYF